MLCELQVSRFSYIHFFFFLIFFPYRPLEYRAEFPVLYSRFLLLTRFTYSSMYMSVPTSPFISSPPVSPGNHKFKKQVFKKNVSK